MPRKSKQARHASTLAKKAQERKRSLALTNEATAPLVNECPTAPTTTSSFSGDLSCPSAFSQPTATFLVSPVITTAGCSATFYSPGSVVQSQQSSSSMGEFGPILAPTLSNEYNAAGSIQNAGFVLLSVTNLPIPLITPITGIVQQPISNLNISTNYALHCLLCSNETSQNLTSLTNCTEQEADFLVMFLLKKILGTPSENLAEYLSTLGHPRGWISLCDTCSQLVTGAFTVQKQIGELEVKLRIFQNNMKEKIMSSYLENQKKFKSVGANPVSVPKSNPVVVTKETRDFVVRGLERINNGATTKQKSVEINLAKQMEPTTMTASSEVKENFAESDTECDNDGHDFSELTNNSPTMSGSPTNELAEPEPSDNLSNATTRNKKRKQTITSRVEVAEKNVISNALMELQRHKRLKEPALPDCPADTTRKQRKRLVKSKLMTIKQSNPFNEAAYCCVMCPNLKSMRLRSFVKHLIYHFDRPYKCSECSAYLTGDDIELTKLSSESQSGAHVCSKETLVKVNLETGKIWDCAHCSEAFKLESERELHEANAHARKASIPLPHNCSRCPKKFRDYPEWQIHRVLEHPDLAKLGCFYCDETFRLDLKENVDAVDDKSRNKHIIEHHGQHYTCNERFECRTCGENFQTKFELKSHAQTQHGNNSDKLHWCPVCFKTAISRATIQNHLQRFHGEKPREKFICDLCAYGTSRSSVFVEHRLLVHGREPESKRTKTYSCTTEGCSFKCIIKGTFDRHMMKEHNAERRFKCRICARGFIAHSHRKEHERTHGTAKPFQCEICGNSFAVKNYLYIHMRLSHQNRPFASTNRKRTPKSRKSGVQNPVGNSTSHHPTLNSLPVGAAASEQGEPSSMHPVQQSISSLHLLTNAATSQSSCNHYETS